MKNRNSLSLDTQVWNEYWTKKERRSGLFYDIIAVFYRKVIFRPALNYFINKYFDVGLGLLHAGCGSGQVDRDIRHKFSITGLDISPEALKIYEKENGVFCKTIQGSIFAIPFELDSVDGIYNLGVFEHFSRDDVKLILSEFYRILRPGGRIVIFWPPEYGLSVMFFKTLRAILKFILHKDFEFHPDEINRCQSKTYAVNTFEQSGFKVLEYSFSMRDVFTYSVVVCEK